MDNKIVGGFAKDTTVNVFEIRTVNGHRWGRTSSGWICLTYTSVKMLTDKNVSDTGVLDYAFEVTLVNSKRRSLHLCAAHYQFQQQRYHQGGYHGS